MFRSIPPGPHEDLPLNRNIHTLEAMKVAKAREYVRYFPLSSGPAPRPSTVKPSHYQELKSSTTPVAESSGVPVAPAWYYVSKNNSSASRKEPKSASYGTSPDCPDWFKITEKDAVTKADYTKAAGFDGGITLLSRINGWITVSPTDRSRNKRLGGPADRSRNPNDARSESDLAPAWMKGTSQRPEDNKQFRPQPGQFILREVSTTQGRKQTFLVDRQQPAKSQFSIGDFRHNVRTREEAQSYMQVAEAKPKNMFAWPENVGRQHYDKPVTGKIGHSEY